MLRWLTRLFGQRAKGESADVAPVPPPADGAAVGSVGESPVAVVEAPALEPVPATDAKETCPDCGRTSVFAGPPTQRFCTYCALRQELFDANASASN